MEGDEINLLRSVSASGIESEEVVKLQILAEDVENAREVFVLAEWDYKRKKAIFSDYVRSLEAK